MARDRNMTVWQSYVIVMSIVSFLSLGWLFYLLFTQGTNAHRAELAEKKASEMESNLRKTNSKLQLMSSMLGVGSPVSEAEFESLRTQVTGDKDVDAAASQYTNHMVLFGPGATEKNYNKLVDSLMQQLRRKNEAVAKMQADRDTDRANFAETIKRETELRQAAQKEKDDIALKQQSDLEAYTAKIQEQMNLFRQAQEENARAQAENEKKVASLNNAIAKLKKTNSSQEETIATLNRKLAEVRNEDFEYAQGRVTDVLDDRVWIDLGKSDGLRPGISFVVMDSDVSQVTNAKVKAKIEVVELIADHQARCKIVDDRAFVPILRGDKIYSAFFQPGVRTEIALVGKMDIDGDGTDDRKVLIPLIEQNQAVVSVDMPPGQRVKGKMSPQIRWLVVSDDIKIRTGEAGQLDPAQAQMLEERQKLEKEAKTYGVTTITLARLMNVLQANNSARTLGPDFRPSVRDYLPNTGNPYQTGRVSELYQTPDGKLNRTLKND